MLHFSHTDTVSVTVEEKSCAVAAVAVTVIGPKQKYSASATLDRSEYSVTKPRQMWRNGL